MAFLLKIRHLFKIAIYSISAIFITGFLAFAVIGGIAFSKITKGAGKSFGLLFRRSNFLRVATVFFIVLAVIYLALLGGLNNGAIGICASPFPSCGIIFRINRPSVSWFF